MPPNYDSLLGKLIVWGEDRDQAISRMKRALGECVISGVPTTIVYHTMILDNADFKKGDVDTGFIPKHADELSSPPPAREVRFSPTSIIKFTGSSFQTGYLAGACFLFSWCLLSALLPDKVTAFGLSPCLSGI